MENSTIEFNKDVSNNEKIKTTNKMEGHLYLLREKVDIDSNEDIFKIGKTTVELKRFKAKNYRNAEIYYFIHIDNCHIAEKILIKSFNEKLGLPVRGREYFKGAIANIKTLFINIISSITNNKNYDYINSNNILKINPQIIQKKYENSSIDIFDEKMYENINGYTNIFEYDNKNINYELDNNGKYWFKFSDIANMLEYKSKGDTLRDHVQNENKKKLKDIRKMNKNNLNEQPATVYINESGLYGLLIKSRMKNANNFKLWLINNLLLKKENDK